MANSLSKNLKEAMQSPDAPDLGSLDPTLAQQMAAFANPQKLMNKPLIEETQAKLPVDIQPIFEKLIASMRDILGTTLSHVFLTGTLVLVVAFVLVFFLKEIPLRTSNQVAAKSAQSDGEAKLAISGAEE
ncbi:hypothetical protein D1872_282060 [compost metagenome]